MMQESIIVSIIDQPQGKNTEKGDYKMKKDDYDPYLNRSVPHPTSDIDTLIHLLKASLGTGVLAMPMAFMHSGLIFGLFGTVFISLMCTYCIKMFVDCAYVLCQRNNLPSLGFKMITELAFLEGPDCLKKFSKFAGCIINAGLLLEMLGVCSAYVLFVTKSMKQMFDYYYSVDLNLEIYMLIILPPLIAINLTRNLKHLTPLSMISNILFIFGVCVSYYYIFDDLPSISERPVFSSVEQWPIFFGTTIFALEGIGVVMPLENNMKTPKHFTHCPGILYIGMAILTIAYTTTGFFGYLKYGDKTEASVTLNFPVDAVLGQILKVAVTIAVFLTYALLFYASMDLLGIANGRIFKKHKVLYEYICRILIVLGTVAAAAVFPSLGPFLSLIGALSLCTVGLIFPPIIDTLVYWKTEDLTVLRIIKNLIILSFGIIGLITGTLTSLKEFAESTGRS